jgi:hypothetical protein
VGNRNRRVQSIHQKEEKRMTENHNTEYSTETDRASGVWAEESRPLERRAPLPWGSRAPSPPASANSHEIATRGFVEMLALNPILAFFAILVDAMVSVIDFSTLEITAPVLWLIAAVVVNR